MLITAKFVLGFSKKRYTLKNIPRITISSGSARVFAWPDLLLLHHVFCTKVVATAALFVRSPVSSLPTVLTGMKTTFPAPGYTAIHY
jgi:hypothetical protein